MINERVNKALKDMQIKAEQSAKVQLVSGMGQALFQGNRNRYNANMQQQNMGVTSEMLMAMNGWDQIETSNMICYNCGQCGHRSEGCTNAKNFDLVVQVLQSQGHNPCEHYGRPHMLDATTKCTFETAILEGCKSCAGHE
jgi:hypothetical protein